MLKIIFLPDCIAGREDKEDPDGGGHGAPGAKHRGHLSPSCSRPRCDQLFTEETSGSLGDPLPVQGGFPEKNLKCGRTCRACRSVQSPCPVNN